MSKSWQYWIAVIAVTSFSGCSKTSTEPAANPTPAASGTTQAAPLVTGDLVTTLTPASEVVTLFLESLKKGDATQTRSLLTQAAQQEIERRGLSIDPLGSNESSFRIGRTQFSDKDGDAAYVEAEWAEPVEGSEQMKTDVVFTVHMENNAWRISGMAIDMGQDAAPVLVDFENMASSVPESPQGVSKATVAAPANATQIPTNGAAVPASPATQAIPQQVPAQGGFSLPPQVAQPVNSSGNALR